MGTAIERAESFRMLDQFVATGGRFLDTALVYAEWVPYGRGLSERLIGDWLRARGGQADLIVATKGGHPDLSAMQIGRLSQHEIETDVDQSLRNLGVEAINLYYLHRDDPTRPVEELMMALQTLVQAGKIRYAGCSNWREPRIRAAQAAAAALGWVGFVADQMLWNLGVVNAAVIGDPTVVVMDAELHDLHQATNLAAVPWSAQANGLFQRILNGTRVGLRDIHQRMYADPENDQRALRVQHLAAETGLSTTQIVLGYLCAQPFTTIPIIGPRSSVQLTDSLQADVVHLSAAQVHFLECGV